MEVNASNDKAKRPVRRTFLLDRKFQLKYTLIIVIVGVAVSAFLGYFIYELNLKNRELLNIDAEMVDRVEQINNQTLFYLFGFVALMALFLFTWGIFITHKVAGPLFVISKYLRDIADGKLPTTRSLRRGDELKAFFDTFAEMVTSLRQRRQDEAAVFKQHLQAVRKSNDTGLTSSADAIEKLILDRESLDSE